MRNDLPLSGVLVIDLTTVVAGPSASQTLADYGADVIKVEAPGGDTTRHTGPMLEPGMASLFLGSNRNKRSIVLDLKRAECREALFALTDKADIFLHNVRPQKLSSLGLSAADLCARNTRLIYVGLHGFGEDGPYGGRAAYDDIIQALSGVADLNYRHMGEMRYIPTIVADKVAGQMTVHAAIAALYQRERTGLGQIIEVPMFETMVQFLLTEHFNARHLVEAGGETPAESDELGYKRTMAKWRRPFRTSDGYICWMPYSDRDWRAFFCEVGQEVLAEDPRFHGIAARTQNIEALYALLEGFLCVHPTAHWLSTGNRLGIACAPVQRLEELESDPHLAAVGMFQTLPAGDWKMRAVRNPVRMAAGTAKPQCPPRLGEHGEEILREAGFADAIIARILGSA
jgi:crotonobetainyl-CoA:carnitine CoA-transferase CaiB-like acyl-CoA transferase